jgi:hypothetical protein
LGRLPLATLAAALLAAVPAHAQVFESVGARALGMGGAFVGVADDGTATYWNPAGLAAGVVVEAGGGYGAGRRWPGGGPNGGGGQEWDGSDFYLALPVVAFSFNNIEAIGAASPSNSTAPGSGGRQDLRPQGVGVSSLTTRHYGLTLVQSVLPGIAVGATLKAVTGIAGAGQAEAGPADALVAAARRLDTRSSTAFDADAGVMALGGPLRVGLTVRNLTRPSFAAPGGEELTLSRQARLGVAWTPRRDAAAIRSDPAGLVLAFDADLTATPAPGGERRQVAAGVERWFLGRRLGLRAGARASTLGAARPVASAGVSLGVTRAVFVDAAASGGHEDGDRGWFVGIRAGL